MEKTGTAYKAGYCDAIFMREYNNTFTGYYSAPKYDQGYKDGKESGVCFPLPKPYMQNVERRASE